MDYVPYEVSLIADTECMFFPPAGKKYQVFESFENSKSRYVICHMNGKE